MDRRRLPRDERPTAGPSDDGELVDESNERSTMERSPSSSWLLPTETAPDERCQRRRGIVLVLSADDARLLIATHCRYCRLRHRCSTSCRRLVTVCAATSSWRHRCSDVEWRDGLTCGVRELRRAAVPRKGYRATPVHTMLLECALAAVAAAALATKYGAAGGRTCDKCYRLRVEADKPIIVPRTVDQSTPTIDLVIRVQ